MRATPPRTVLYHRSVSTALMGTCTRAVPENVGASMRLGGPGQLREQLQGVFESMSVRAQKLPMLHLPERPATGSCPIEPER